MPLEIHRLEESELGTAYDLMWEAFKPDIMGVMYPAGFTAAARAHSLARALKAWRKAPETIKKFKVLDTDLPADDPHGGMVGVSDWHFHPQPRTDAELEAESADSPDDDMPPDCNAPFLKAFGAAVDTAKTEQIGGRPYVYLHLLVTHPQHVRRGVGAMQLRWGFAEAEKLGLPVYLESSPVGRALYAREGFEMKGWLAIDAREFGCEKELPHALMLRPAKGEADARGVGVQRVKGRAELEVEPMICGL
ncbi:hypothetical protein LTR53_012001 [Teratosphaeriaceae sp. CCFEE 6253]|nr:hypothetical protein LTR53_012001 [Teratosphaeriaceae sp. CCFEE 6253]